MSDGLHNSVLALIRLYHRRLHPDQDNMTPATTSRELLGFRRMLTIEEDREADEAFDVAIQAALVDDPELMTGAVADLLHELADKVILAYGTAMRVGVDLDKVVYAVMRANMGKVANPDPTKKAIKPDGWMPADAEVLAIVEAANARCPA